MYKPIFLAILKCSTVYCVLPNWIYLRTHRKGLILACVCFCHLPFLAAIYIGQNQSYIKEWFYLDYRNLENGKTTHKEFECAKRFSM